MRNTLTVVLVGLAACSSEPFGQGAPAGDAGAMETSGAVYAGFEAASSECVSDLPRLLEVGEPCGGDYGDCTADADCSQALGCVGDCIAAQHAAAAFADCVLACYPSDAVREAVQAVYWCACCEYPAAHCGDYCSSAQGSAGPTLCL